MSGGPALPKCDMLASKTNTTPAQHGHGDGREEPKPGSNDRSEYEIGKEARARAVRTEEREPLERKQVGCGSGHSRGGAGEERLGWLTEGSSRGQTELRVQNPNHLEGRGSRVRP